MGFGFLLAEYRCYLACVSNMTQVNPVENKLIFVVYFDHEIHLIMEMIMN